MMQYAGRLYLVQRGLMCCNTSLKCRHENGTSKRAWQV